MTLITLQTKLLLWGRSYTIDLDDVGDGGDDYEDDDEDGLCGTLTLLARPTQTLLLTLSSSCDQPILDQFEVTADQYKHDEVQNADDEENDEYSPLLSNWRNQSKKNDKDDEAASFLSNWLKLHRR